VWDSSVLRHEIHSRTAPVTSTSKKNSSAQSRYATVKPRKLSLSCDNIPGAELAQTCQFSLHRQEEQCTPASPAVSLHVSATGMTRALEYLAMPDRSAPVSGNIDSHTVRRRRSHSPRKSRSRAGSNHASSNLDQGMNDDSATIHGILALSSKVGLVMSDDYTAALEEHLFASGAHSKANTLMCSVTSRDLNTRDSALQTRYPVQFHLLAA
jgi:hypothetical protein